MGMLCQIINTTSGKRLFQSPPGWS